MTLRTAALALVTCAVSACEGDAGTASDAPPPPKRAAEGSASPEGGGTRAERPDATPAASPAAADAAADGTQRHAGALAEGDETLESGEFADGYSVRVREGETITVEMAAPDFDGYLILRAPSGAQEDNDDDERAGREQDGREQDDSERGDGTDPRIAKVADETGTWRVIATSFSPGETGAYRLTIRTESR